MKPKTSPMAATLAAVALLAQGASARPNIVPVVLWNTTASAPLGFYRLSAFTTSSVGEWVAVLPPAPLAQILAVRGALPLGVPLLKEIAAVAPSSVCRRGFVVTIDGREAAVAQALDRRGRPLPVWEGCTSLKGDEVFLLTSAPGSFDSRYFGALSTDDILGQAKPLWLFGALS